MTLTQYVETLKANGVVNGQLSEILNVMSHALTKQAQISQDEILDFLDSIEDEKRVPAGKIENGLAGKIYAEMMLGLKLNEGNWVYTSFVTNPAALNAARKFVVA